MIANESNNYNRVIDHEITYDGVIVEPITLAEAKVYARCLTGNSEDNLLTELITSAREAAESMTALSIVSRKVKVAFLNPAGYFALPFGPVKSSPAPVYKDSNGSVINPIVIGYSHPVIQSAFYDYATAEYSTGFTALPKELKDAIGAQITFLYENRGDNSDSLTVCVQAKKVFQRYSRIAFIN